MTAPYTATDALRYEHQAVRAAAEHLGADRAYHWTEVPHTLLRDIGWVSDFGTFRRRRVASGGFMDVGLDGVAIAPDGSVVGIQAKCYGPQSSLTFNKLGTFRWAVQDVLQGHDPRARGLLVHTPECRLETNLRETFDAMWNKRGFARLALPLDRNREETVDREEVVAAKPVAAPPTTPRPHQVAALTALNDRGYKIGLYVAPCGTGKTLVVALHAAASGADLVVIASPLRVSAAQNLERTAPLLGGHRPVHAWSGAGGDPLTAQWLETAIRDNTRALVSTTFQSLPLVSEAAERAGRRAFLVVDEAHNLPEEPPAESDCESEDGGETPDDDDETGCETSEDALLSGVFDPMVCDGSDGSDDSDGCDDSDISERGGGSASGVRPAALWRAIRRSESCLLVTATPPAYILEEHPDVTLVHRYHFADAIRDGSISDYKILVPSVSVTETGMRMVNEGLSADSPQQQAAAARANFLIRGMLQEGSRRCIAFCASKSECRELTAFFERACEEYFGVGAAVGVVTCDTSDAARDRVLRDLQHGPLFVAKEAGDGGRGMKIVLRLVASVRILDEAVDVPACDCVFFANVPRGSSASAARSVQRLCRALRLHPGKEAARAFVWTGGDAGEDIESDILSTFSMLREFDPSFGGRVAVVGGSYDRMGTAAEREVDVAALKYVSERYVIRAMTPDARWLEKLARLGRFVVEKGRQPRQAELYEGIRIGSWCATQRMCRKRGALGGDRVAALEAVPMWWWEGKWKENFEVLKRFSAAKGRLPKWTDVYEGVRIGMWSGTQRMDKRKGILGADRVAALEAVAGWRWEEEDPWPMRLEQLLRFIAVFGRLPKKEEKQFEGARVGSWCATQRLQKKKGKLAADKVAALEAIAGWRWEEGRWPDQWSDRRALLSRFVAEKGLLPMRSEVFEGVNLGHWCANNRNLKKKGTLNADRVAALEAVAGWRW